MDLLDETIARLAREIPGSTRVFRELDLDFCCGGGKRLGAALAERGLAPESVVAALQALRAAPGGERDWAHAASEALIEHILQRYHARHREQLPELVRLASRVEQVHGERPDCPRGLADHLMAMHQELESHMMKEEQILFPMLAGGMAQLCEGPVAVMRAEHEDHGLALQRLLQLTGGIALPKNACNTWRALYAGLAQLREELMQHIHLENNILFQAAAPREAPSA